MANEKYLNIVTSQHRDKEKFIDWLTQNLNKSEDLYLNLNDFLEEFDIDTAVGIQLDTIGQLVGRDRELNFQPTDGSDPVLDDDDYRNMLKAKIAQNQWDGTIDGANDIFALVYPELGLLVYDNQDMTMEVAVSASVDQLTIELIQNGYIVPKPAGVNFNVILAGTFEFDSDTFGLSDDAETTGGTLSGTV